MNEEQARALLRSLCDWCKEHGVDGIEADVGNANILLLRNSCVQCEALFGDYYGAWIGGMTFLRGQRKPDGVWEES